MSAAKRRRKGAKRTISPEQQAKMQAARKRKAAHAEKVERLRASGQEREGREDATLGELRRADAARSSRMAGRKHGRRQG